MKKIIMLGFLLLLAISLLNNTSPSRAQNEEENGFSAIRNLVIIPIEIIGIPALCLCFSPEQSYWKRFAKSFLIISISFSIFYLFIYMPLDVPLTTVLMYYVISIIIYVILSLFVRPNEQKPKKTLTQPKRVYQPIIMGNDPSLEKTH
jgi:hypothetical protein